MKDNIYTFTLRGYCSLDIPSIQDLFQQVGSEGLVDLPGEFVIIAESSSETYLITSRYGVTQYFYTLHDGRLFHGNTVLGVVRESGISWEWNWGGLADVIYIGHTLENETLHPAIRRMPAASVLHFANSAIDIQTQPPAYVANMSDGNPASVLRAFNDEVEKWASAKSVISMSGGFDSRAILSSFLHMGQKPLLAVMGFENSTDVVISKDIAKSYGLEIVSIALKSEDYLNHANTITALSNGTTMAVDWHTYIFIHNVQLDPQAEVFIGTNGEFARSFACDRGILSYLAQAACPYSLQYLWKIRIPHMGAFSFPEVREFHPSFGREFDLPQYDARVKRLSRLCYNSIMPGLDRFYLEQRVRVSHACGVQLYSDKVQPRMPFLGREWVESVWNMARKWKFGSNWHRYAIEHNCPGLMKFPEEKVSNHTSSSATWFYWLPHKKKKPVVRYQNVQEWFRGKVFLDYIRDNASFLTGVMDRKTINAIVDEQEQKGNRTQAISILLALSSFSSQIPQ